MIFSTEVQNTKNSLQGKMQDKVHTVCWWVGVGLLSIGLTQLQMVVKLILMKPSVKTSENIAGR